MNRRWWIGLLARSGFPPPFRWARRASSVSTNSAIFRATRTRPRLRAPRRRPIPSRCARRRAASRFGAAPRARWRRGVGKWTNFAEVDFSAFDKPGRYVLRWARRNRRPSRLAATFTPRCRMNCWSSCASSGAATIRFSTKLPSTGRPHRLWAVDQRHTRRIAPAAGTTRGICSNTC